MTKFTQVFDGDPVYFEHPSALIECCDCSLTHLIVLMHDEDGRPYLKFFVDEYQTKAARKRERGKK